MIRSFKTKNKGILVLLCIALFMAGLAGCGPAPVEPEIEEPPVVQPVPAPNDGPARDADGNLIYKIIDNREDKNSLVGRYEYNSEYGESFIEIFDDHALTNEFDYREDEYSKILEIDYSAGLTWLAFASEKPDAEKAYYYTADLYNLFYHSPHGLYLIEYPDRFRKTPIEKIPEATDREKELLYFDSETFIYHGKTMGEIYDTFPDLTLEEDAGYYKIFCSPKTDIYFIIHGWDYGDLGDLGNERRNEEPWGFGVPAKTIFPNMGDRVFKHEIESISRTELYGDMYEATRLSVHFQYQGYGFQYYPEDSYDILPDTIVFVYPPR